MNLKLLPFFESFFDFDYHLGVVSSLASLFTFAVWYSTDDDSARQQGQRRRRSLTTSDGLSEWLGRATNASGGHGI